MTSNRITPLYFNAIKLLLSRPWGYLESSTYEHRQNIVRRKPHLNQNY